MKNLFLIPKLMVLILFFTNTSFAQTNTNTNARTIKVSGSAEYNLSPNEIIIQLAFQEYFSNENETTESKVTIEKIEEKVVSSILKSGVKKTKITDGGVQIVRPYKGNVELKRRLNKTIFVCVDNVEQYVKLTRTLEDDKLFDKIVTVFQISEFKHTEKDVYLTKSRSAAYQNAVEKAKLILSQSGQKLGKVLQVTEVNFSSSSDKGGSFYSFDNNSTSVSGFRPIIISYTLEVQFEIE